VAQTKRIIISGGGTGGHIYPAIAIANALKAIDSHTEILFVGAEGKMEMQKVPQAGYKIIGLPIAGIQRKLTLANLSFPFKLVRSLGKARQIVKDFKPDVAVGVGGYASGPVLYAAASMGIPTLIQEQNSYAGLTNKWLARKAKKICVAYEGMGQFFPVTKIRLTGNPVRQDILQAGNKKAEAIKHFNLWDEKPVILAIGGSLGARTINESLKAALPQLAQSNCQLIWQTGKFYYESCKAAADAQNASNIKVFDFIAPMDLAYAAADVVISRAGALSISELCLVGKPAILVPSPNVSEDHQTKNAMALVKADAALLVKDVEANTKMVPTALELVQDENQKQQLSRNILKLGKPDAARQLAEEILELLK
jgi:UDP-N-acetylglucosamine--N-acetylmuramyl-(pentapeptide) pyrophosphoryl-undecaprenol N-acetylglucosamine transferase